MGKLVEIAMVTQWEVGRREDKDSMAGNTAIPKLPALQPCLQEWEAPWQAWDRQPSCGEEPGHPLKSTTPLISSVHTNPSPPHDSLPLTPRPLYQLYSTRATPGSPFPRHIPLVATALPPQLTKFVPHLCIPRSAGRPIPSHL